MPRASWKGFLRLSLVSCPVYLSPATTRLKAIRLHQVWVPQHDRQQGRDYEDDADEGEERVAPIRPREPEAGPAAQDEQEEFEPTARISLRPHDPHTGEEIEREEVRKGYEYDRDRYVTFTADELRALDVESSKTIDLATFVPRADVDPLYFNASYYVYPDGRVANETYRVISAAMSEARLAGLGRLTLGRRKRMVMVEPRRNGMVLITLRAAEEVRAAIFDRFDADLDPEAVAIAAMIIKRRTGTFDPTTFRDRYQDALRELIEAKMRGLPLRALPTAEPPPPMDLMAALKRSLAQDGDKTVTPGARRKAADRRQRNLLLPVDGDAQARNQSPAATRQAARRRKA